jgi:hypothetical protein
LVYFLDHKGAAFLAERADVEPKAIDWDKRQNDPSWLFLNHLLATNDVRIALEQAIEAHGWQLLQWRDDRTLQRQKRQYVEIEYTGKDQKTHTEKLAVLPDGYFFLATNQVNQRTGKPAQYHRFLEMDMGTVPGTRTGEGRRDWTRKVKGYIKYYNSGLYRETYHATGLRVLTVTTSQRRLENLLAATETAGGRELFLFTTLEHVRASDPLTMPIWRQPGSDQPFTAL